MDEEVFVLIDYEGSVLTVELNGSNNIEFVHEDGSVGELLTDVEP